MAEIFVLAAERREAKGKGPARRLRMQNKVPAIVYGGGAEPLPLALPFKELKRQIGSNPRFFSTVLDLDIDGEKLRVLPREAQLHPVSDDPLHVDFIRAAQGARVVVEVPVVFQNELASPGLKRGGVLNIVRRALELLCPVDAIPAQIVVDLTGLEIHDSVHISHVKLPENVTPTITDRDFTICSVAAPLTGDRGAAEEAASAIRAPTMPGTGTMSASWPSTRSPSASGSAPGSASSRGWSPRASSAASGSCC